MGELRQMLFVALRMLLWPQTRTLSLDRRRRHSWIRDEVNASIGLQILQPLMALGCAWLLVAPAHGLIASPHGEQAFVQYLL
ncbi:hypothetical protein [Cyanobium sp. A1C-AMD]|uniref:hypothetical protein n=1 Tax=Cyanobium sp. A1C-AMD TaxID=2823694 RepID=UPI0020CC930D|nr:hypothetical protein [Cyanobium sp. A1C-AMD]